MNVALLQIRVGIVVEHAVPKEVARKFDTWKSGIRKAPATGPVLVTASGLDGDEQADLIHHGGNDKAILCYPRAHYEFWLAEFGEKAPGEGTLGENFELSGVSEEDVCIGDVFQFGEVQVQISQPRQPCWKPAQLHGLPHLTARILNTGRTGWYLRVLRGGMLAAPETAQLVERPCPEWSVARATRVMHFEKDAQLRGALGAVEPLSNAWKNDLRAKPGA